MPIILEPIPIEGNGSRPSHRGNGYGKENEPMFTLNGTEIHGVAYGVDTYNQAVTGGVAITLRGKGSTDTTPCVIIPITVDMGGAKAE